MKTKRAIPFTNTMAWALCLGAAIVAGVVAGGMFGTPLGFVAESAYAAPAELEAAGVQDDAPDLQAHKLSAASAKPTKAQIRAFKKAASNFSLELFAQSVEAKGAHANVTVSPYSVMNALAMTANGAAGKTSVEMRRVLGGGMSKATLNKMLSWYDGKLVNSSKARISNANALWYHNDGTLAMNKKFLKTCKKYYGAKARPADFADTATVDAINSWVAKKTNNMIKRVVSQLDPDDRIALVNALYFDAKWRDPFDKSSVSKGTFTTSKGKKRSVKMMHGTEYSYIEGSGVCGFIKPYAKGYSYVALLPDEGVSLKKFVASLDGKTFRSLVSHAKNEQVRIAMPKHTLTYTNESMQDQLIAMGMPIAFSDAADFKNMARSTEGPISLGKVVHKTKVKVDENGTKAAAVTAVIAKTNSAFMGEVKTVTLDRPFVYAIIDNTAKLPIFIGTVNAVGK